MKLGAESVEKDLQAAPASPRCDPTEAQRPPALADSLAFPRLPPSAGELSRSRERELQPQDGDEEEEWIFVGGEDDPQDAAPRKKMPGSWKEVAASSRVWDFTPPFLEGEGWVRVVQQTLVVNTAPRSGRADKACRGGGGSEDDEESTIDNPKSAGARNRENFNRVGRRAPCRRLATKAA